MNISQNRLVGANEIVLNHQGREQDPTKIAIHYSVTDDLRGAVRALNSAGVSYHVLIEPDGSVHQTRPFTLHAAHAGRSNWKATDGLANTSSLNRSSISISLINRGFFGRSSGDMFFDTNAHGNPIGDSYPASEVDRTTSIYHPSATRNWHRYPGAQIEAARQVISTLVGHYADIDEIVGHDGIAIDAKFDPGPLFPLEQLRGEFNRRGGLGLRAQVTSPDGVLTLRQRPTGNSNDLRTLRNGDEIHIRSVAYTFSRSRALFVDRPGRRYLTAWASVDVDRSNSHSGYVHMRFLSDNPLTPALSARL